MPKIGKPEIPNSFTDIKINKTKALTNGKGSGQSVGEQLNNISGIRRDSKFVDRKTHNKMGKDGFLKLLTNQLSNQDPFKPVDQKEFAGQLAQFSQLEQLTNMNQKMDARNNNVPSETKFYGASFLGKEVLTNGTTLQYSGQGESVDIPFQLEKDAKNVFIRLYDSRDQLIAQLEKEGLSSGSQNVVWDGTSRDGTIATKDTYRIEVLAYDKTLQEFHGKTNATGVVTGVEFENGETVLIVDHDKKVFLRDVESFKLPRDVKSSLPKPTLNQAKKSYEKNLAEY